MIVVYFQESGKEKRNPKEDFWMSTVKLLGSFLFGFVFSGHKVYLIPTHCTVLEALF